METDTRDTHDQQAPPNDFPTDRVCGVVVVFQPDADLAKRIDVIRQQVDHIIVVDNGSGGQAKENLQRASVVQGVETIRNASNLGVATALNQGARRAGELGFEWVLTLDQDSIPAPDMVRELWAVYRTQVEPDRIAIVAPQVIDAGLGRRAPFLRKKMGFIYERAQCEEMYLENVTTVITSGALVRISAYEAIGGYRDDFFIDYVDTEFCLRVRRSGFRIVVACRARLNHYLGKRRRVSIGPITLMPTFHSPERWYYMSRNRIPMLKAYALRFPHWLTYELIATIYVMLRMLLTEDQRVAKLRAIVQGTRDGLKENMGIGPILA